MKLFVLSVISFVLFFGLCSSSIAQVNQDVQMQLDSFVVLNAGINTLDIQLQNNGSTDFEGIIQLDLPQELNSLSGTQVTVHISAGKKRFLSVKLRSNALYTLKGRTFPVKLIDHRGEILMQKMVDIEVPEKRSVVIQNNSEMQYLRQIGDSVYVRMRVINSGTTDEQIRLLLSSPDRVGDRDFQSISMLLPSGKDSLIQVGFVVEKYMLDLPQYTVRVSAMYENSDVFGNFTILFSNIASNRNYQRMFNFDNNAAVYSRNYIDLQVNNLLEEQRMYYLRSEGEYRTHEGKIRYSAYVNQMSDLASRPNVNSTFVEYERKNTTVTLGNLQESLDAPLYGRGVKVAFRDSIKYDVLEAGIVEKSNDLLGFYGISNPGFTAFTRLVLGDQQSERKRYEGQAYYDNNKMDSTESILWTNTFDLLRQELADKIQIRGFLAGGVNRYWGELESGDGVQPSAAMGVKLNGRSRRWTYSSDNFFSTAYYTGNRRGALQLSQRVNRSIKKLNYGMGYFYSRYEPEYLNSRFASYSNSTSRLDASLNMPISTFVSLSVQPNYNQENGSYFSQSGILDVSTHSWQLLSSANMRSKNFKHNMFLTMETGLISIRDYTQDEFVLRGNFSYNYGALGLFGSYQKGAFQAYEVLNSLLLDRPVGNRLSFGASYGGNILQKKLAWNANIMSNLSSDFGNSYNTNINTSYRVLKNTLLTGVFQYSYTKGVTGYNYDFTNLCVGFRQNLKSQNLDRPAIKTGNLKVFCFYDNNSNNIFDEGDEAATGYGFMVREILFVTDRRGNASFKKMPYGEYTLFFPLYSGYQAISKLLLMNRNSMEIEIPLQKVGTAKGRVSLEYDANLSLSTNLELDIYKVVAKNQNDKTFEAHTDQKGEFQLSLPQGDYTFYLDNANFPENIFIEDNARSGKVEIGKTLILDVFQLNVKSKKIEVKRFGTKP
ncbi:hypothetical protein FAZ15_10330 [Sphingobacterium olei]|uniref:Carboxypeptidase regulatory-like domain-containing protein n=1 Tax=Sphingobacterium olei TaxID=2571155 RepID=A0A4U0NZV2_9SPHI|nr:hypothetical protein [Sphingobacterium olei]TJZ60395.1 hypothetical protein FAZ15_10330 [Sphingobacterium olei]